MTPFLETAPYVGFNPTTPQNEAGKRMDPPVSSPRETTHSAAATLAADPPPLPPETRVRSWGFFVGPNAEFSVDAPMPNSSIFVFPMITPPASFIFFTTVASYGAT